MSTVSKVQMVLPAVINTQVDGSRLVTVLIEGREYDLVIQEWDKGLNPKFMRTFENATEAT